MNVVGSSKYYRCVTLAGVLVASFYSCSLAAQNLSSIDDPSISNPPSSSAQELNSSFAPTANGEENLLSAAESVEELLAAIERVEAESNSFAPELGELSFDLGQQLDILGLHDEALNAFLRADQNIKVREGLYSDTRETVVRKIHEQHIALKDWETAESALRQLVWLKARNLDSTSLENVEVLQDLVEWNLALDYYGLDESDESSFSLLDAYSDLNKIYRIYELNNLPLDDKTIALAEAVNRASSLKVTLVSVDQRRSYTNDAERSLIRQHNTIRQACESNYRGQEAEEASDVCVRLARRHLSSRLPETIIYDPFDSNAGPSSQQAIFLSRGYYRGKEVLLDQLELYRQTDNKDKTLDAILSIADWYLLYGYQGYAEETYRAAWNYAVEQRLPGLLQMATTQPISIASILSELPNLEAGNKLGMAEFEISINSEGEVQRLAITELDIEDEAAVAELIAEMSTYRYRPALHEGRPIEVDNFSFGTEFYY